MKIINLIQKPQLRGAEIFACQLSNHLVDRGHDVIVVSIFPGDSKLPFKGEIIHLNRSVSKRLFDYGGWKLFNKIIEDFKPDIIQANAADTLKFAVSSKLLFKWDSKIIFRNANKMGDFIDSQMKWQLNKFYINRVDHVISVSKECEKDFIKTFKYSENLINTVEIGVEETAIDKLSNDLSDIFQRGPVLVHIGGFVPEKNHEGLLKIFARVKEEYPEIQLVLLGKGKLEIPIKNMVNQIKFGDDVHFLGHRLDVLEILKSSRAFLLPSFIEGLPGVILEAMYCKTPVVAYDVGGISEVVKPEETGWLIEKGDEDGFVRAIHEVLNSHSENESRINAAKRLIHHKFLNSKIAERFEAVYEKVVAR
ncbi:glycosyltransferase [Salinimicrobium flavum]|uniref:Glycosyltransferase n=1 Tax=Salinimicrobium flavum TaxID=1737065 RepID=A0ABW5J0T6_9FLAO